MESYSYTKATRLKLVHLKGDLPKLENKKINLTDLIEQGQKTIKKLEELIDEKNKQRGKSFISPNITINKSWLKSYFKHDFYNSCQKEKEKQLNKLNYAYSGLKQALENFENQLQIIEDCNQTSEHQKQRFSFIAEAILTIKHKNIFPLLNDFSKTINHKTKSTDDLIKAIDDFNNSLENASLAYAPTQGAGLKLCQASLNYHTVNKKPKEYDKNKLKNNLDKLTEQYNEKKNYKAQQKSELLELIAQNSKLKAEQVDLDLFNNDKNVLQEFIDLQHKINENQRQQQKIKNQKNYNENDLKKLKTEKENLTNEKKKYFVNNKENKAQFTEWKKYCEEYRRIAQQRGRLLAEKKGIEREQLESQLNRYWAVIHQQDDKKQLWCIPKEKMQKAKEFLEKNRINANKTNNLIYSFDSLTKRALHKLCFAEQSSFVEDMPNELQDLQKKVKQATNDPEKSKKNPNQLTKDKLELDFYKQLLKSDYAKNLLNLANYDQQKITDIFEVQDLNDFEQKLQQACYIKHCHYLDDSEKNYFLDHYGILAFELTSYDLEKRYLKETQTPASDMKPHTKELWNTFWQEKDSNIRLNPEIAIFYRPANNEIKEYFKKKQKDLGLDLKKIKHRYLQEQYTAKFSFELNAGKLYQELAFAKPQQIAEKIDQFNQQFNTKNWDDFWKYGVDRGNIELATLCIAKFNKNEVYNYKDKTILKPTFPKGEKDIKTYQLKTKKYNEEEISQLETKQYNKRKPKRVIANLSYFIDKIDDKNWFEEKTCTCIDLTTAKLINDKIILNGDILTFLKLKKESAKRKLFELVASQKITEANKELCWEVGDTTNPKSDTLCVDKKEYKNKIYYFEGEFGRKLNNLEIKKDEHIFTYTKENIKDSLQNYLNQLLEEKNKNDTNKHVPTINKINHLRDALVANMIGIIFHLQSTYPGIVLLENLDVKTLAEHFQQHNINLGRRLEYGLYQKFQSLGLVPPHLKNTIELRENYQNKHKEKIQKKANKKFKNWIREQKNKDKTDKEKKEQKKNFYNEANSVYRKNNLLSQQLGAIVFVDEYHTSKNCPYCENTADWGRKKNDKLKFSQHRFVCGKDNYCDFDTSRFKDKNNLNDLRKKQPLSPEIKTTEKDFSQFSELNDPDKIAAYNVAKKISNPDNIAKWDSKIDNSSTDNSKEKSHTKIIKKNFNKPQNLTMANAFKNAKHKK